jgi:hypothetical protein
MAMAMKRTSEIPKHSGPLLQPCNVSPLTEISITDDLAQVLRRSSSGIWFQPRAMLTSRSVNGDTIIGSESLNFGRGGCRHKYRVLVGHFDIDVRNARSENVDARCDGHGGVK